MWGTASTGKELTGNFGDALEDTSIGDCRLFRLFARNQSQGILGLLQHYRPNPDIALSGLTVIERVTFPTIG
jgi:hypothetical protein